MTNADLIASLVAGFLLLIVGVVLLVKIRATQPLETTIEGPDLEREEVPADSVSELEPEEDLDFSSLENLEFRVDASDTTKPAMIEIDHQSWQPEAFEESAAPVEETPEAEIPCPEPPEPVSPEIAGELETSAEAPEKLIGEIKVEAEQIHAEIDSLTSSDAALRRATLRPAPSGKRQVSEALDSQISDLDHRLDALEALVASIEESLAELEPLLEDEQDPARALTSGDDRAEAA